MRKKLKANEANEGMGRGGVAVASEAKKKSSLTFRAGVQFSRVITILTIN